jgi:PKD repeat protein
VTFGNASAAATTATFSTSGTYVLQLTASDSVLLGTSNVTVTVLAPGDFNGDGRVDGVDFLIWQSHYPTASGATPDGGDANDDGKVDGVDFLIWQANYHG